MIGERLEVLRPAPALIFDRRSQLRLTDGMEIERLRTLADAGSFVVSKNHVTIDARVVVQVRASLRQLADVVDRLTDLAELRNAYQTADVFADLDDADQFALAGEFAEQTAKPFEDAPAVTIVDIGVNSAHPLFVVYEGRKKPTDSS